MTPMTPRSENLPIRARQLELDFRVTKSDTGAVVAPLTPDSSPLAFTPWVSNEESVSTLDWLPSPGGSVEEYDDFRPLEISPSLVSTPTAHPLLRNSSPLFDPSTNCPGLPASTDKQDLQYLQIVDLRHLNRTPFSPLDAQSLNSMRRHTLKNLHHDGSSGLAGTLSPAIFVGPTLQGVHGNQRLGPLLRLPNGETYVALTKGTIYPLPTLGKTANHHGHTEIFVMVWRFLRQRKTYDTAAGYFYHKGRERGRNMYLKLHPRYFGRVPRKHSTPDSYEHDSLWPLMHTCHDLRNRILDQVMSRTPVIVNVLDLDAFITDLVYMPTQKLNPVRFAKVHAFVPGGQHPPLPIHPFLALSRAEIPAGLVFDREPPGSHTTPETKEANLAMRARMELALRRMFEWMEGCGSQNLQSGRATGGEEEMMNFMSRDACSASVDRSGNIEPHDLLVKIYLHPNCDLYVTPSPEYKALYPVPREWSQWWRGWQPGWMPTVSQLQTDLGFLHRLTGCSVWLDISRPGKGGNPTQYDMPRPHKPYEETQVCQSMQDTHGQEERSCIDRIRIGDPYGLRIHAADEFLKSSAWKHHLRCLLIPFPLVDNNIFLKLFSGTDCDGNADRDSLIGSLGKPCDVHCLLRIQRLLERKLEMAKEAQVEEDWQSLSVLDLGNDDLDESAGDADTGQVSYM